MGGWVVSTALLVLGSFYFQVSEEALLCLSCTVYKMGLVWSNGWRKEQRLEKLLWGTQQELPTSWLFLSCVAVTEKVTGALVEGRAKERERGGGRKRENPGETRDKTK